MDIVKREFDDPKKARPEFMNVKENWALYDTILIFVGAESKGTGWFSDFAAMGAVNQHYFFNVRSRSVGLPYCNMDKRDSMAFPMWVESLGVTFFAPQVESTHRGTPQKHQDDIMGHIWEADIPRHASIVLTVMQDERVKNTVMLVPPGYGPIGGGVGQGDAEEHYAGVPLIQNVIKSATSQSTPDIENRYRFPVPLEIPRNGRLQATLKFSAYGRGLLAALPDPGALAFGGGQSPSAMLSATYGIQVSLLGKRAVQQRGAYHA